ncbi:MAG: alpha/beta fold hydrolase [Pseudomonadota bacterium]
MTRWFPIAIGVLALAAIVIAAVQLLAARQMVVTENVTVGSTPATIYRPVDGRFVDDPVPAVVIAHGFAGSRTLMSPFAVALARNGYLAVTFDFVGHGEHPLPMTGDVNSVDGPTQAMIVQLRELSDFAAGLTGADELAVLGHSMASDIVVRFASQAPDVSATVAVSMFSPAVTATEPRNLLVIVGDWEGMLKDEALRAVGLATAPDAAEPGETYGAFEDGSARRVVFAGQSEHIAVLFDTESLTEAVGWLDNTFDVVRDSPVVVSSRLPWIGLLILGVVALAYPLSRALPVLASPRLGAGLGWRRLWPVVVVPAVLVPVSLRFLPTDFLPIVVGDYLAVHFLGYGVVTYAFALWAYRRQPRGDRSAVAKGLPLLAVTVAVTAYAAGVFGYVIEATITIYHPVPARFPLFAVMLAGTLSYFLASEWATRGEGAGRGAAAAEKIGFVVSLAIAVALDFERLFFLIIIVPVIALFFVIYGLFGRWSFRRTGHPVPGAVATAVAFAWGITVTFPMLAG